MLDDLKYIHQKDTQDALGIAEKQWSQLTQEFRVHINRNDFSNVVFSGMGGSALAALIGQVWPSLKVPFIVSRNYDIPAFVDEHTLFIASSYSGNTEETLEAFNNALNTRATVVVIAGGGKLLEEGRAKDLPCIELPKAAQPRFAVLYSLAAYVAVLGASELIDIDAANRELKDAADFLRQEVSGWSITVPVSQNPAKKLALNVVGTSPVIYGGALTAPIAYKWKISFNENAKNVAWWNQYPEFNHNEFIGWSSHPVEKPYAVIDLCSSFEHPRLQKRFSLSDRLLSGKRPAAHVVELKGETVLQQLLWGMVFGDFTTLYVALLNGLDPSPVDLVEKFKVALDN